MSELAARPRGRRPGGEDTRGAIVEAARGLFAADGYDAVSIRAIARAAGVDPALVHHYFEGKGELLAAVLEVPVSPRAAVAAILSGDRSGVGERLAAFFFQVWDTPDGRARIAALLSAAATQEEAARILREFLTRELFGALVEGLQTPDGELRAGLAAAQMVGVAVLRYVVRLPAVVAASPEQLVAWLAPTLQRYLVD